MTFLADLAGLATTDLAERQRVVADRSGYRAESLPDAVVVAHSVDDVVRTMRAATAHRVPIVVRGAGTGLAGGCVARAGEVVLDMSQLRRILSLDPLEQFAVVEPGVLNAEVEAAAAEHGLFYAPDPASTAICSIGGNIATNAGGMRCAKYGVTRESVLGLTVVLADGRILKTGGLTIKGVTGYDLNALFIGSEGTLGVVVEAALRLRPAPVQTAVIAACFASVADAARAASAVVAARVTPTLFELMDASTLHQVDAHLGTELRGRGEALLIAQTDGFGAIAERDAIVAAMQPFASDLRIAESAAEADELLHARRQAIPAVERLGTVAIGDVGVPRGRLAEMVAGIEQISRATGVPICTIGHVADGNLHPLLVVGDGSMAEGAPKQALADIFHLARSLGGTLTGEHGVGHLKREWVAEELGDVSVELHHAIKRTLDPLGILAPGRAF